MIQVIHRALDIIEYIGKDKDHEHMLSEIANHLGLNHGTCANIIKTLVTRNYLEQVGKKRGYKLGFQIFNLTGCFAYHKDLIDASRSAMKRFTKELNEGSILSIVKDDVRVIIYEEKAKNELQVNVYPEKPIYSTSTGRMMLAHYDSEELEVFVQRYGLPKPDVWPEVEDIEDLKLELKRIRKKEICFQVSKYHICGIAVPIYNNEEAVASLGTYLPVNRFSGVKKQQIIESLIEAGKLINQHIKEIVSAKDIIHENH